MPTGMESTYHEVYNEYTPSTWSRNPRNDTLDAARYAWSEFIWPETERSVAAWQTLVHETMGHLKPRSLTDPVDE